MHHETVWRSIWSRPNHSCWLASFLAFCLGGRPAIYTIYIPYISLIYSIYIYNYMHIWRAARNVKTTPANNYASDLPCSLACASVIDQSIEWRDVSYIARSARSFFTSFSRSFFSQYASYSFVTGLVEVRIAASLRTHHCRQCFCFGWCIDCITPKTIYCYYRETCIGTNYPRKTLFDVENKNTRYREWILPQS